MACSRLASTAPRAPSWQPLPPFASKTILTRHLTRVTTEVSVPAPVPTEDAEEEPCSGKVVLLDVEGMKCGGCSAAVKRILTQQPGVRSASVNLLTKIAAIQVDGEAQAAATEIAQKAAEAVSAKGFATSIRVPGQPIDIWGSEEEQGDKAAHAKMELALAWGLVLVCCTHHVGHMLHGAGLHGLAHGPVMTAMGSPPVIGALGALALLGPGRSLLIDGFRMLWAGAPNMNSLISLGATTSFLGGIATSLVPEFPSSSAFLEEPVMLLAVVLLGRTLEAQARTDASGDLRSLAALIPASARLVMDLGRKDSPPELTEVPSSAVRVGDVLRVLPGERMPVDGIVTHGRSAVDESMLTGESKLVDKQVGATVTAGTINYEGPIDVEATATGSDSVLAGIGRMVVEAQSREAPVARLADSIAGKFCYGVMSISLATGLFWGLAGAQLFPEVLDTLADTAEPSLAVAMLSLKLAIDVLVVACPCALGLATPTAVLVASSSGAKQGLLLRGGDVLEQLAEVDTVVLDKTGTLTDGKMSLADAAVLKHGLEQDELLRCAAAVEATTRHPIADAVLRAVEQRGMPALPAASGSVTIPGCGVTAMVDGRKISVGTEQWVSEQMGVTANGVPSPAMPSSTSTEVFVGREGDGLLGKLVFQDSIRPDSIASVAALKSMGLDVHLFSGDNAAAVAKVARSCGIDSANAHAEMSPSAKAEGIQRLQASGSHVAMVGDGINDAPALAAADVGVALQGGVEVASGVAGVVLMGDRLGQVVDAVGLGRATLSKIKQNLVWALAYNLVGIPVAAGALLPHWGISLDPSVAAGLMAGSSLAVVSNSLLLRTHFGAAPDRATPPSAS